jgi:hypothetical protein
MLHNASISADIVVYTDNPEEFKDCDFPLTCVAVSKNDLEVWKGPLSFTHRVKIEILIDAFLRFKNNIVYTDADTLWVQSPQKVIDALNEDTYILHTSEGKISNTFHATLYRFLTQHPGLEIPQHQEMFNAGSVGIPWNRCHILHDVLKMTDRLLLDCHQREWLEQLAFSYYLSRNDRIYLSENEVFHYWTINSEVNQYWSDLLKRSDGDYKAALHALNIETMVENTQAIKSTRSSRQRKAIKKFKNSCQKRKLSLLRRYLKIYYKLQPDKTLELTERSQRLLSLRSSL